MSTKRQPTSTTEDMEQSTILDRKSYAKPPGSTVPARPTRSSFPNRTTNYAHFQCGDKSHEAMGHVSELEARIRHNCDLPKTQTTRKDEKGRTVTTIIHRAVVTQTMVENYHKKAEQRFKENGGKVPEKDRSKSHDWALADRKELEEDDWEVIDDNDVDDTMDVMGEFSGRKVRILMDGLQ